VLTDDELRAAWKAADKLNTPFARMVQFILLTGVRRNEAARMTKAELDGSDWLIPAARVKGKWDFLVPLSSTAAAVIAAMPSIGTAAGRPVFTNDVKRPLRGFGKVKAAFDRSRGRWSPVEIDVADLRFDFGGVAKPATSAAAIHKTGGRPTEKDRIIREAKRRMAANGPRPPTLTAFARELRQWLDAQPDAHRTSKTKKVMAVDTIEGHIRSLWNRAIYLTPPPPTCCEVISVA
jgi:integrase